MGNSFGSHLRGGGESAENITSESVQDHIEAHEKHDRARSWLSSAISSVYSADETSLESVREIRRELERAEKSGDKSILKRARKDAAEMLTRDRSNVEWQDEVSHYTGGFFKTASLFFKGKVGIAGSILTFAADQANPHDSLKLQVADMTLGGMKGGLMKGAFHVMGAKRFQHTPIAVKGIALGSTMRVVDMGLTQQTYLDSQSGKYNLGRGLGSIADATFNRDAILTDAMLFVAAHGLLKGANGLTGGAIDTSPFLQTSLTGTTFGLSSGSIGEIQRQHLAGESFDLGRVLGRGAMQGLVDTFAAAPGGMQADINLRNRTKQFGRDKWNKLNDGIDRSVTELGDRANRSMQILLAVSDNLLLSGQPRLAFEYAGIGELPGYRPLRSQRLIDTSMMMSSSESLSPRLSDAPLIGQELVTIRHKPVGERIEPLEKIQDRITELADKPVVTEKDAKILETVDREFRVQVREVRKEAERLEVLDKEMESRGKEMPENDVDLMYEGLQLVENVIGHKLRNYYGLKGEGNRSQFDGTISIQDGHGFQRLISNRLSTLLNEGLSTNPRFMEVMRQNGLSRERALRWLGLPAPGENAADLIGGDYLLIHRGTGELIPLDITLRAELSRQGATAETLLTDSHMLITKQNPVPVERENWVIGTLSDQAYNRMIETAEFKHKMSYTEAKDLIVTPQIDFQLSHILGKTLSPSSPFNIIDVRFPSTRVGLHPTRQLYELWRFRSDLVELGMRDWAGATKSAMGSLVRRTGLESLPWKDLAFRRQ